MAARSISPGDVYGRWTVLATATIGRGRKWHCRCVCGAERQVRDSGLKDGTSTSCGCYHREFGRELLKNAPITVRTHGMSHTPEYEAWHQMLGRCTNPRNHAFKDYGGRGITVCPEWRTDFARFLSDMGPRLSPQHSLDRYPDNDGPYAPGNCRWATEIEQHRNKRTTRWLTARGQTLSVPEWADRVGLPYYILLYRLAANWPVERALSEPVRPYRKAAP